jgi:hypothetical protein
MGSNPFEDDTPNSLAMQVDVDVVSLTSKGRRNHEPGSLFKDRGLGATTLGYKSTLHWMTMQMVTSV